MYVMAAGGLGDVPCTCQPDGTCAEDGNSCSYTPPASGYQYTGAAALYCDGSSPLYNVAKCNNLYVPASTGQTFTQWLNANSNYVMYGGIGLVALAFLMGGRR